MTRLIPDQQVPDLTLPVVGGQTYNLTDEQPQNFSLVVFYRGLHCPVCKGYLNTLDGLAEAYGKAGVTIVAASMNDEATATKTKAEWGIKNLRLGYGLSETTATAWNLYLSSTTREAEPTVFCEPGLFLVRPDGRLYLLNITNMPWGRPNLEELLSKIAFIVEKDYPARGVKS